MARELEANWEGAPPGSLSDFVELSKLYEERIAALVGSEIQKAVKRGKVSPAFEGKLVKLLTEFRDQAALSVNTELTVIFTREVNRYGKFYSGRIKGIVKPKPPKFFVAKLRAIEDVVNNIYQHAMRKVNQAAAMRRTMELLERQTNAN